MSATFIVLIDHNDLYAILMDDHAFFVNAEVCNTIRERPEIYSMSVKQRNDFFQAVKALKRGPRPSTYDRYAKIHYDNRYVAHNSPQFFPWHRAYLREFEKELQRVNPSVMLPYWDWSLDSQAPELSQVFTESMFGGNGRENDTCLIDGQFANWQVIYPTRRCLNRRFDNDGEMSAFSSPEAIKALLVVSTNYDKFRRMLEAKPHAQVHNSVGGDFRTMYTANDPLFWLHHGFIDKLWADWQALRMSNARSYGGRDEKGVTAKISDIIAPFGYRVEEVFRTQDLCYEYGKMPVSQSDHNYDKMIGILTSPSILRNISICTGIEAIDQENLTTPILPDPHDREELVALRDTVPIPDDYIRMNHLSKKTVVEAEKLMRYFTQEINSNSDYVSPAALINRPEMLELIAQTHNILSITNGNIRTLFRASDFLDQKAVISRHLPECTP